MSPTFRAAIDAIASSEGGKITLSPDVLLECVEAGETIAHLDGAVWVIEQLGGGRALTDILAEVRRRLDAAHAELGTRERDLRALGSKPEGSQ